MDPTLLNILGPSQLISSPLNKVKKGEIDEGEVDEKIDELSLDLTDEELLTLRTQWENDYKGYEAKLKPRQEANKNWYLGKQGTGTYTLENGVPIHSNLLFEAVETFLPAALAKNPEPVVYSDNTEIGNKISNDVKTMLQFHADQLNLRTKLKQLIRSWAFNFIGVIKFGWDAYINDITIEVRDPQNFVFSKHGFVDAYGDMKGIVGEKITVSAKRLTELFPKHKLYISTVVDFKMGTDVTYTEWWNDDYTFTTFKDIVLDKSKNPYFNYEGQNHFARPFKPYVFLNVFSNGVEPHDVTGLIEQNIPNQNRITKREAQIDMNLDRSNNSIALSGLSFNSEESKQAAQALQKGNPVRVPDGRVQDAIARFPAPPIPDSFFKASQIDKEDLRSIFGTEGITASPPEPNDLATTRVLNQQHDSSRIGGGVGEAIENVAKSCFNWFTQLYYVYYDEEHFAAVMGQMKAVEYVTFTAQKLFGKRFIVTVAPDSMKSHDEITEMNQAIQLYEMQALDPKTLLTILNVPDPQKTAEMTVLWTLDKGAYMQLNFPELSAQLQQIQMQNAQAQQAQLQQQMELQGQQAQQQMNIKGAQANQELSQKEAVHQQKLAHTEQAHEQKMRLSPIQKTELKAKEKK